MRPQSSLLSRLARMMLPLSVLLPLVAIGRAPARNAELPPPFWRGVFLFGMPEVTPGERRQAFFRQLVDSLHLNVIQVRTYNDEARLDYFLTDNGNLWVLAQDSALAAASADPVIGQSRPALLTAARRLLAHQRHLRFYLADEPDESTYDAWGATSSFLKNIAPEEGSRSNSVSTLAVDGDALATFIRRFRPAEVLINPYFLTNNIPHPTLRGRDQVANRARILPWGDDAEGYGWYLGYLQGAVNDAVERHHRRAAEMIRISSPGTRLILVPQLHGVLAKSTDAYDKDARPHDDLLLRPPAPAEIRLQYSLGIAYGVKGFLAYPYGFDANFESGELVFPGLVPRDPLAISKGSNEDRFFGRTPVWTGYREKWEELAVLNGRLVSLGDTLAACSWVGAKSWSMDRHWKPVLSDTPGWNDSLIRHVEIRIKNDPQPHLPLAEIGHLRRGTVDYIAVVNRRCATADQAVITLFPAAGDRWTVSDVENPRKTWSGKRGQAFSDTFRPGDVHVYRLSWHDPSHKRGEAGQ